jgi:hypothetical protein
MIARAEARARGIHQRASACYMHQRAPAGGNIRGPGLLHAPEGPGFSRGILRYCRSAASRASHASKSDWG